jgi:hypothetical protein
MAREGEQGVKAIMLHRGEAATPSPSALRASTLVRSSRPKPASTGEVKKAGEGKFRRGRLGSTVCPAPEAHKRAAQIEREGGWTATRAIAAAKRVGQDWRAAALAAWRRLKDDAGLRRARCIPPGGVRRGPRPVG